MNAIQLLLLSVLVFVLGGIAGLLNRTNRTARLISGITGIFGSLVGFTAAVAAFLIKPILWQFRLGFHSAA